MPERYAHLGEFSDLVTLLEGKHPFCLIALPGPETQQRVRETLAFPELDEAPSEVHVRKRWERDGVAGEAISWSDLGHVQKRGCSDLPESRTHSRASWLYTITAASNSLGRRRSPMGQLVPNLVSGRFDPLSARETHL
jgi:hypothetical protein